MAPKHISCVCGFSCARRPEGVSSLAVFIVSCVGPREPAIYFAGQTTHIGQGKGRDIKTPEGEKRLGQSAWETVPAPRDAAVSVVTLRPGHTIPARAGLGFVFAEPRLRESPKVFSLFGLFFFFP